jgi:hypothetical protein
MMLPTHALGGLLVALPLALVAPEFAEIGLVGGLLGGIWPDLDLYTDHRKRLHFPVYYSILGVVAVPIAVLFSTPQTVVLAGFLLGAALHSVSDVLGGGLELRPWEASSERAVYSHYHGRWLAPSRVIRYDGAPEDLLLSVAMAVPLALRLEGAFDLLLAVILAVAAAYTVVRRVLPRVAELLVRVVPPAVSRHLPDRYHAEHAAVAKE